jgi:putative transposase
MMQKIKGKSSYKLFNKFSHLKKVYWGRHFWARGYLAVSTGSITDEMVQKYIEEQEGQQVRHGDIE